MTLENDESHISEMSAVERTVRIANLFTSISRDLDETMAAYRAEQKISPKSIGSKISELQSVHTSLIKAEEAFHEKFSNKDAASGLDYDVLRDEIGRQLDRIRAALGSE
ncbi:hypothetical protein [Yoonia sp. MH D7]